MCSCTLCPPFSLISLTLSHDSELLAIAIAMKALSSLLVSSRFLYSFPIITLPHSPFPLIIHHFSILLPRSSISEHVYSEGVCCRSQVFRLPFSFLWCLLSSSLSQETFVRKQVCCISQPACTCIYLHIRVSMCRFLVYLLSPSTCIHLHGDLLMSIYLGSPPSWVSTWLRTCIISVAHLLKNWIYLVDSLPIWLRS